MNPISEALERESESESVREREREKKTKTLYLRMVQRPHKDGTVQLGRVKVQEKVRGAWEGKRVFGGLESLIWRQTCRMSGAGGGWIQR
jgi:predicted GNAT family N-acyltransferase